MIIEKLLSNKAKVAAQQEAHSPHLAVPERQIRELVQNLRVGEAQDFANLLEIAQLALLDAQENHPPVLDWITLDVLRRLIEATPAEDCRRFLETIVATAQQGTEGIETACFTITRFVKLAFWDAIDHVFAEALYKELLESVVRNPRRRASG